MPHFQKVFTLIIYVEINHKPMTRHRFSSLVASDGINFTMWCDGSPASGYEAFVVVEEKAISRMSVFRYCLGSVGSTIIKTDVN